MLITNLLALINRITPFLFALIGFCTVVTIHELGHFLFCKLFGIHTPTFSIGMGPKIFERKLGDTNFRLSALPLGGYVEIAGFAEVGQGEQAYAHVTDQSSFIQKKYWQKFLVLMGGIIFNLLSAYIIFILVLGIGSPKTNIHIKAVTESSPAMRAGLLPHDRILQWNGTNISANPELLGEEIKKLHNNEVSSVTLVIRRQNEQQEIEIPVSQSNLSSDTTIATRPTIGIEGFELLPSKKIEKLSWGDAIRVGISRTNKLITDTVHGILGLFKQGSLKGGAGPIMILAESTNQARQGFSFLCKFLAIISINLAIINLIPLPVLDGGQIVFVTIESIIRRPIPEGIRNAIHIASWLLLLTLIIIFSYNDIRNLISR